VPGDLNQPFLGGAVVASAPYFSVCHNPARGWVMDGGEVHGIPRPADGETTSLALFASEAVVDSLSDVKSAIGEARVTKTYPTESTLDVHLFEDDQPQRDQIYKAVVTALPLPPLTLVLEGDLGALALLRQALSSAGPEGGQSLLVREGSAEEAVLRVVADENRYRIRRVGDAYALAVDTDHFTAGSARLVVERLEHMARWLKTAQLSNPSTALPSEAVQMELIPLDEMGQELDPLPGRELYLPYYFEQGEWRPRRFKIRLKNTAKMPLYCALFDLPETFGIFPLQGGASVRLEPGEEAWAEQGKAFPASIPNRFWQNGMSKLTDLLKVIVSTDEIDAYLLAQDDLPVTVNLNRGVERQVRGNRQPTTLNRLMRRVHDRHVGEEEGEAFVDWVAAEVSVTTERPQELVSIPERGRASLGSGVSISGHTRLRAQARLASLSEQSRSAGNLALPALLRDCSEAIQPYEFSTSRSGEPGLSALELTDVENYTVVTREDPLILTVAGGLGPEEQLLPVGFDGQFFLPLGRAERTGQGLRLILERLPAPTSAGSRDVKGAARILFQKVAAPKLGLDYPYPVLAAATVGEDGTVAFDADLDTIGHQVERAEKILLLVHGLLGDTRDMVLAVYRRSEGSSALVEAYDLVLTLDYESVHTPLEETARTLKRRLQRIGIGPRDGKAVDVIAHSAGGLVARWFVEREGGAQMVDRLTLVGTPNQGSPWPTIQDLATTALAIGLNSLATVTWPVKVLSLLLKGLEVVDVTLDQMKSGSDFLKTLNSAEYPGVPYIVVAGHTAIIPAALEPAPGEQESALHKLFRHLHPPQVVQALAGLAFLRQPNDIFVSVHSVKALPEWGTPAVERVVGCDHFSYFTSETGLRAIF
jgi:pimeloyl-ACP methyl ester carboxylesterase